MSIPDNVTLLDQVRPDGDRLWNEKKKERTRVQLLEAAVRLVVSRGIDQLNVNDLSAEVALPPGTFYNHFPSLDALIDDLAAQVVAGIDELVMQRNKARDPSTRIAVVLRGCLRRAREDGNWARLLGQFAARAQGPVRPALLASLRDDIVEGIGKGQFVAEADESADDLVVGALLTGVARVAGGEVSTGYERNLTTNILRGLGMVSAAALERAQRGL